MKLVSLPPKELLGKVTGNKSVTSVELGDHDSINLSPEAENHEVGHSIHSPIRAIEGILLITKLVDLDFSFPPPLPAGLKSMLFWSSTSMSVLSDRPNALFDSASASCGKQHLESEPGKKAAAGRALMRRKIANASVRCAPLIPRFPPSLNGPMSVRTTLLPSSLFTSWYLKSSMVPCCFLEAAIRMLM